jgi:endonuclease-3
MGDAFIAAARIRGEIIASMLLSLPIESGEFLRFETPFQLLVAVMLSARCTDRQVNRLTPKLFLVAPDARSMAALPQERLEELIHGAGFFHQKARAIAATSRLLLEKWSGDVPLTFQDLESLPGVGHKTASVVIGHCTDQPTFPVDTHVYRLARRWKLSAGENVGVVERDLKEVFPPSQWLSLHRHMIIYGRKYCTARGCDGSRCAICKALFRLEISK